MLRIANIIFIITVLQTIFASEIKSNFYWEECCSKAKGFCLLENECPHSVEGGFRDLCPMQKDAGAVCCKNFPQDKVNCYQTHNICRKTCPQSLDIGRKGCPEEETCCILI